MSHRLIAVGLMAAIGVFLCCNVRADSKVIHDPEVTAASYSTGEQGNRLKWMPYRPMKPSESKPSESKPADKADADKVSSAKKSQEHKIENKPAQTKRVAVRWNEIDWSDAGSEGVRQVDFRKPAKPSLDISEDPLKNPFNDPRRAQDARTQLARVGGPNLGAPLLHPVANRKDATPLPGLSPNDDKDAPRMLLTPPSDDNAVADAEENKHSSPPSIADELAKNPQAFMDRCPDRGSFKSIDELDDNVTPKKGKFPPECALAHEDYEPRVWTPTTFAWTASGMCHKPLYFEQPQVERYGHSWGPILQPLISGGHFFITVPILPYKMGTYPPGECMYSLGYYRPGSCAPYMLDPFPISVRGGLVQAGAVVGVAAIVP